MDSMIDSLFDQYERGGMTRRHLVQALAVLVLPERALAQAPAPTPIVRGLSVNHIALTVSDVQRSFAFYERLFGVTRGWPATDAGTGIHMDLPDGYISIDSVAEKKGVITHFAVAVDHMDRVAAKRLADKINSELPDAKASIRPIPAARRPISGIPTASSCKSHRKMGAERNVRLHGDFDDKVLRANNIREALL
jgi:hypothetical protein